jgi:hypothetical protein
MQGSFLNNESFLTLEELPDFHCLTPRNNDINIGGSSWGPQKCTSSTSNDCVCLISKDSANGLCCFSNRLYIRKVSRHFRPRILTLSKFFELSSLISGYLQWFVDPG